MSLITTINNRKVYSDKQMERIDNTRVWFTDGSWCNVETNEINNAGQGYIRFDTPPTEGSGAKAKIGPKSFSATGVGILDVPNAAIDVQPHDGNEVIMTIEGPGDTINALKIEKEGNDVVIEGASGGGMNNVSIISGGSSIHVGNVRASGIVIRNGIRLSGGSIFGGNVVVSGGSNEPEVTIIVKVPRGGSVRLAGDWATARIGDTEGNVDIRSSGVGETNIGKIANTRIRVSGTGSVNVKNVKGNLKVGVSGTSNVSVDGGEVSELEVNVSGVGNANLNVNAEDGDLNLSGVGGIYVRNIKNRPIRHASGMGQIKVGNW